MKNIPKKIYLQTGIAFYSETVEDFNDLQRDDITWSDEQINKSDIEYVLMSNQSGNDSVTDSWQLGENTAKFTRDEVLELMAEALSYDNFDKGDTIEDHCEIVLSEWLKKNKSQSTL